MGKHIHDKPVVKIISQIDINTEVIMTSIFAGIIAFSFLQLICA